MKKLILILALMLFGLGILCTSCNKEPEPNPDTVLVDVNVKLVMVTYNKAWIDGANACIRTLNAGQPWDIPTATALFVQDSLAYYNLIKSIGQ